MNWKQFLTEKVLDECWHEWRYIKGQIKYERWECVKCPAYCIGSAGEYKNRTFDNRNDMMDLYDKVWKDEKWREFDSEDFAVARWIDCDTRHASDADYNAWLFCLDGEGYEDHCKMVAEFYGYKEADHD